jgi:hypothetical protein
MSRRIDIFPLKFPAGGNGVDIELDLSEACRFKPWMRENGARSPRAVRRRRGGGESFPLAWRIIPHGEPFT